MVSSLHNYFSSKGNPKLSPVHFLLGLMINRDQIEPQVEVGRQIFLHRKMFKNRTTLLYMYCFMTRLHLNSFEFVCMCSYFNFFCFSFLQLNFLHHFIFFSRIRIHFIFFACFFSSFICLNFVQFSS